MKREVELNSKKLSFYEKVEIETELLGKHMQQLAAMPEGASDVTCLSILGDLLSEGYDKNKLTLSDVTYLFTLLKMNSLGADYVIPVKCLNKKSDGTLCEHVTKVHLTLAEGDLRIPDKDYQIPTITLFDLEKRSFNFQIKPPYLADIINLKDAFLTQFSCSPKDLVDGKHKEQAYLFSLLNMLYAVVNPETQERPFVGLDKLKATLAYVEELPLSTIKTLTEKVKLTEPYGLQYKTYEGTCEECGQSLTFRLPLLFGLTR